MRVGAGALTLLLCCLVPACRSEQEGFGADVVAQLAGDSVRYADFELLSGGKAEAEVLMDLRKKYSEQLRVRFK